MFVFHPSPDGPCRPELAGRAGQRVSVLFADQSGTVVRFPDGAELSVPADDVTREPDPSGPACASCGATATATTTILRMFEAAELADYKENGRRRPDCERTTDRGMPGRDKCRGDGCKWCQRAYNARVVYWALKYGMSIGEAHAWQDCPARGSLLGGSPCDRVETPAPAKAGAQ